jgi:ammonia channel protein AmtB
MGVSLAIGIIGGVISTIGYLKINHLIEKSWLGIHDTCGIASLHAIPGFLGGLISAIVLASYQIPPGYD